MPPFGFPLPTAQHTEYDSKLVGERKFEGLGPILSFEGARPIAGNKNIGNLDVNVSLEGGVLFGDRDTRITGSVGGKSFDQVLAGSYRTPDVVTTAPVSIVRSESATVPTAAVNLGLSYTIDRMKIGAGYRWERYFDAIDGGYDEAEDFDRTIDGPYFKLSVGFGGG